MPPKKKKKAKKGKLNFYINDDKKWLLELTREKNDPVGHIARFGLNGKYSKIPTAEWLVVDFRSSPPVAEEEFMVGLWTVCYSEDFKVFTVYEEFQKEPITVKQIAGPVPHKSTTPPPKFLTTNTPTKD